MRYCKFNFNADMESLEALIKEKRFENYYDGPVPTINNYIIRNIKNDIAFFIYRVEEGVLYAAFAYNERKDSYSDVWDIITGPLKNVFQIKKIQDNTEEITIYQYTEFYNEGKRRDHIVRCMSIKDASKLWIYEYYNTESWKELRFDFDEKIISGKKSGLHGIYSKSLTDELESIEEHKGSEELTGNVFHYVISSRSLEAAEDITGSLMNSLIDAGRISSRRMEIVRNISSDLYRKSHNHLEDIIENNFGGVVVIDLTEKAGERSSDYVYTCEYLEKLVKKYRNNCLFAFTYNINNPGFSYLLLPKLSEYVIPVAIKEGSGDRKMAVSYLKELLKNSEYEKYAGQAEEYMKLYPGEDFAQTDVLNAFEKFGPWCMCKNVLNIAYEDYEDFLLDRDENEESAYEKLKGLIGLDLVKKEIDEVITSNLVEKERKKLMGKSYKTGCMHMVFSGNPGTAKTTVAELFARIAKETGVLRSGAFVVRGGMDLCGLLCVDAIRSAFVAAKGGVLFIDEAYSMKGDMPITVLIQEMENHREDVIVVLAGYEERMKIFMEQNEGLKSRVPYWIDFPDYSEDELTEIFKYMIKERGFSATEDAIDKAKFIFSKCRYMDNFGNGRFARNLMENAIKKQSVRLLSDGEEAENVPHDQLFLLTEEDIEGLEEGRIKEREPGTAAKELEEMIGLSAAKEVIHKAVASFKVNKQLKKRGISREKAAYHMVFTGNPGTAKTTVARLLAEILKDEKVLPAGTMTEVGRSDLVGMVVGSTAMIVKEKFRQARGGILFIDEAYSLCDDHKNSFGDEAINTIVQEMENHREDVIVIFAGYPEPMKEFLERNPGMSSRIAFHVDFEDYSIEELTEITKLILKKKQLSMTDEALKKLVNLYKLVYKNSDFGNGRFVRKAIEESEMNLAIRLEDCDILSESTDVLTTIEACDIPPRELLIDENSGKKTAPIGFAY